MASNQKQLQLPRTNYQLGGDLVYPTPPPPTFTLNTLLQTPCSHITSNPNHILPTTFYPPILALGSTLTPTPWPMVSTHTPLPLHRHPQTRKATDSKARNKARKARHRLKRRRGPLTIPLSRPSKLHFYCHYHGWVTTHSRVAIWTWWTSWRCVPINEVSSPSSPPPC
jgi:hypothetical protein